MKNDGKAWTDYTPQEAKDLKIDLSKRLDITAPLTSVGERCPWPWEPEQFVDSPLGQYHCTYCGEMVMAGMPHIDYRETETLDVRGALAYLLIRPHEDGRQVTWEAEFFGGMGKADAIVALKHAIALLEMTDAPKAFELPEKNWNDTWSGEGEDPEANDEGGR